MTERLAKCWSAYHIEDAPDPGAAGLPEADGGVDDLDGDERARDGTDAGAAKQPALGGQTDEAAGHRAQEQTSCMHAYFFSACRLINLQASTCRRINLCRKSISFSGVIA